MIDPKDIPDSAVEAAIDATRAYDGHAYITRAEMRVALAAALNDMLGEPVGWEYRRLTDEGWSMWQRLFPDTIEIVRARPNCEVRPVYALKQGASHD